MPEQPPPSVGPSEHRSAWRWLWWRAIPAITVVVTLLVLSTCSPPEPLLSQVERDGVLHIATTNSPTTCYQGPTGPTGYECELLGRLAHQLGVRMVLHYYRNGPQVLAAVDSGRADVGAAGLIINDTEAKRVRFTAPLRHVTQKLVYRMGEPVPKNLGDLHGTLEVVDDSAAAVALASQVVNFPKLQWKATDRFGSEDLLYQVSQGALGYTVANSDLIAINQRYYPNLKTDFDLSPPQPIAWALRLTPDESLYNFVQKFLKNLGAGTLQKLHAQYFSGGNNLDYLGVVRFTQDFHKLLPKYHADFERAAKDNGLDWRLLAAMGYQESHWDPTAVSPTGVRGLMMLTSTTAARVNVDDRENAAQSIDGAARYFADLMQRLPDAIKQPDRTWMALAAYNMGMGHLEDARVLAQKRGGNPNLWKDVKTALPLLMQDHWFSQTRHGYARGAEALAYVRNIRSYYDILVWFTGGQPALIERNGGPKASETNSATAAKS